jgi:hypothetical protein
MNRPEADIRPENPLKGTAKIQARQPGADRAGSIS